MFFLVLRLLLCLLGGLLLLGGGGGCGGEEEEVVRSLMMIARIDTANVRKIVAQNLQKELKRQIFHILLLWGSS